jgi:CRP-like cAMP-binding protein
MYIILDGEARVMKVGRDGEVELARLAPADSFGEMALADNETRSASVVAITSCALVRINGRAIDARPEIGLKVYRNISRVVSERLRAADDLVAWRL